jgi:hypothetical protein
VQDAWQGKGIDPGKAITDSVMYAFGPGRAPNDIGEFLSQTFGFAGGVAQMAQGQYETRAEEQERLDTERRLQMQGAMPTPEVPSPRLQAGGVL